MKIDLFSTPVFLKNIDVPSIDLKSESFEKRWLSNTLSSYAGTNKLKNESSNYLLKIIGETIVDTIPFEAELELTYMWENRYDENDFQEKHIHVESHFSFIIYASGESSNTVLFAPNEYLIRSLDQDNIFKTSVDIEARPGQILIFPSYLEHMVKPSTNTVTYSGNVRIKKTGEKYLKILKAGNET